MKIAITGTSGLAKIIKDTLESTPYQGDTIEVTPIRCDDITMNGTDCWIFDGYKPCDVLINFAHQDQAEILMIALTAAATFSILDTYVPSLAMGARSGAGFGIGANLVDFPSKVF